jgi:cell division protein FtsL
MLLLLIAVAVASALGVVYMKYRTRMLYAEVQRLQQVVDAYEEEWGQLQLEQNTWAEHGRIERMAGARLKMILPPQESIIYIQP